MQHIQTFSRDWNHDEWLYTFTQEWPVPGLAHQLSYTLAYERTGGVSKPADMLVNYRYQLLGDAEAKVACTPRLSLILPTGDPKAGTGNGSVGVQAEIAVSTVLGKRWVAHTNVGGTVVPSARDAAGQKATTRSVNLGQSFIWQTTNRFNVMLESVWSRSESVAGEGRTARQDSFLVSPGIRWAYNYPSGLQIVPGVAFPFGVGPSAGQKSVFFYLSFEGPVWKPRGS